MPICQAVWEILYEKADVQESLEKLFQRSIKNEF
jgi:glycerol-3-phosphate dehydrogenase